jgi:hypothetical protein
MGRCTVLERGRSTLQTMNSLQYTDGFPLSVESWPKFSHSMEASTLRGTIFHRGYFFTVNPYILLRPFLDRHGMGR